MNTLKLTAAVVLGLASSAALVRAQSVDSAGMHSSEPRSTKDANIVPADTRSAVAPDLPTPPVGPDAGADAYLQAAQNALSRGRTGEAQQSLEMAETRALGGSIPQGAATIPGDTSRVTRIHDALQALGEGDRQKAVQLIQLALGG